MDIAVVGEANLPELLPLLRGYCDFYDAAPSDDRLLAVARSLIADPDCEGFQLIARGNDGRALGFATVYWTWSTLAACRKGVMNDLFVHPDARGSGLGGSAHRRRPRPCPPPRSGGTELADGEGEPPRPARL
jgi:GNAT superfamily N-acetyltransferase